MANELDQPMNGREDERQIQVSGELKKNARSEMVVFSFTLLQFVQLTCIVPVPDEGTYRVPVYIRIKLSKNPIL